VPPAVREVCDVLTGAGFEAVTVGGAVRDVLLGRVGGDWDVATSAHPDEVVARFARTIPTGMAHGTVTVIAGRGAHRMPIEVTTYRGDGAYVDGRRPTSVVFGVPLTEDLARRDLVVNAIAYDPVHARLIDPFDGRGDLAARRLRAVGDPAARFAEDGLRIMRAIRFAATLGFALDGDTTAAIPGALPSLAKVSRERVKVELDKLLGAPAPGAALTIARATGVLAQELPEATVDDAAWPARLAWLERAPAEARLAVLVAGGPDGEASAAAAERALRRLKAANDERDRAVRLVRLAHHADPTERVVRRALGALRPRPRGAGGGAVAGPRRRGAGGGGRWRGDPRARRRAQRRRAGADRRGADRGAGPDAGAGGRARAGGVPRGGARRADPQPARGAGRDRPGAPRRRRYASVISASTTSVSPRRAGTTTRASTSSRITAA
jgi:tRNA nucleotidyltransferase (CCA-adding enzyme)